MLGLFGKHAADHHCANSGFDLFTETYSYMYFYHLLITQSWMVALIYLLKHIVIFVSPADHSVVDGGLLYMK